jgi:hypothetical protein
MISAAAAPERCRRSHFIVLGARVHSLNLMAAITLEIPADIAARLRLPPARASEELRREFAVFLVREGILPRHEARKLAAMVRRDEAGRLAVLDSGNPASCCGDPAGESPVSVSGDAPSSRARTRTERVVGQAGRRKPVRQRELCSGEQARGPQHKVKPAASTQLQSEGRAAHLTAKATSTARDCHRDRDLGGVRGRSTCARITTEHERAVCAAAVTAGWLV